ncbi:catalase/peroxidase HPI [Rhodopirellula halodulae]|uniref:catalase/peroxidase HPI n=1 Tax=Rhodopirellula halodulae TaxID=2894198 RepID=UPI001E52A639|nr:catalase/peroxidase HPI [Rhodopirellula sp. JC737]MCC9654573.1 catalase/peroxidase HPI [Rhodopirellula sp. JC737]
MSTTESKCPFPHGGSSKPVDMENGGHDTTTKVTTRAATTGACPFRGTRIGGAIGSEPQLDHWWPNRLKVELLHRDPIQANPLRDLNYQQAFSEINYDQLKADIRQLLRTSVDWWPCDYGNYGPQMIRMAWHSAGTYRIADGRGGAGGGMQRFAPINSWWDNGNTDKSRRLLWPIKQKYGAKLSWADLMILTGNVALEDMGFRTFGFAGGRIDQWEPDSATYWGPEGWAGDDQVGHPDEMVTLDERWEGDPKQEHWDLENPVAATHQAIIYVNPEGPDGNGDPMDSAREIRESFARMAMNDEETVALIAGGHAFGKSHGMVNPAEIGAAPEAASMKEMGLGWNNPVGTGNAEYTMTNGIEGSWTSNPTQWDNEYLQNLFTYEWKKTESPAGALQWTPVEDDARTTPDAHIEGKQNPLMMMTSDIALKEDPIYRKICERFLEDFDYFADAFSRAWYKLTHRDMGPVDRYVGPEIPDELLPWQDPVPSLDHETVSSDDIAALKTKVLGSGLSVSQLVSAAWASASTYRDSDKRGGANGARVRLEPQINWEVNNPAQLKETLATLESIQQQFNESQTTDKKISIADLIVLAGCAGIEKAAQDAGIDVEVPFVPGRMDTTQEWTDEASFEWLKPVVDGFRNYRNDQVTYKVPPEHLFLDKAHLLKLTAPEWTALSGGLKVLNVNHDGSAHGVFTETPGRLTNDFFRVLTSMEVQWEPQSDDELLFDIKDRETGETKYTATRCDLVFGSNAQLRQVAEVYAADDGHERLVNDFVQAWHKVMMLDRFDVPEERAQAMSIC